MITINVRKRTILIFVMLFLVMFGVYQYESYLDAQEDAKNDSRTDVVEKYIGPIVGYIPHLSEKEIGIVVRDINTGKLGYGYIAEAELENEAFQEVAEVIQKREYGTMIGISMEYSSWLDEKGGYENGKPIVTAWLHKGESVEESYTGSIVTYFDHADGKIIVLKSDSHDQLIYIQTGTVSSMSKEIENILYNEICNVRIEAKCVYYDSMDYEAYPASQLKLLSD